MWDAPQCQCLAGLQIPGTRTVDHLWGAGDGKRISLKYCSEFSQWADSGSAQLGVTVWSLRQFDRACKVERCAMHSVPNDDNGSHQHALLRNPGSIRMRSKSPHPEVAKIPFRERIRCSISEACYVGSLGRTTVYKLISTGQIKTVKVGRRTLVSVKSLVALLEPAKD